MSNFEYVPDDDSWLEDSILAAEFADQLLDIQEHTAKDLLIASIEKMHETFAYKQLGYIYSDQPPAFEWGAEVPLVPDILLQEDGKLADDELTRTTARYVAKLSVERLFDGLNADFIEEVTTSSVTTKDWVLQNHENGRQVFIRARTNTQDTGQQTYATLYPDTPPRSALKAQEDDRKATEADIIAQRRSSKLRAVVRRFFI